MIKLVDISREMDGSAVITAFADSRMEVPSNVVTTMPVIKGLPSDITKIASSSVFYTASLDIGIVQDSGVVVWTGDSGSDVLDSILDGSITSIKNDITSIGNYVFAYAANLEEIDFPEATNIGEYAFTYCGKLVEVNLPKATNIGESAFSYCSNLERIELPELITLGKSVFNSCGKLVEINLPKVTSIDLRALYYCSSLTDINVPNVISIGDRAFSSCSALAEINLPKATSIGKYAFQYCSSLTGINAPNVTSIGEYAFSSCSALAEVIFPKVGFIGASAFQASSKLKKLVLKKNDGVATLSNITAFTSTPFYSNGTGGTLYVPQALISSYQSASNWSKILSYPNNQILPIEGSPYEEA